MLHETRLLLPDGRHIDAWWTIAILSFRLLPYWHKYTGITDFFSACNLQTIFYILPSRNPTYTYKKGNFLPSSIKYVFQRNLKCIFSVPFLCYWTGSPIPPSNLPQGCPTAMTNYTSYEVLHFLLHFIFPYGLHPFPTYFYHIDL